MILLLACLETSSPTSPVEEVPAGVEGDPVEEVDEAPASAVPTSPTLTLQQISQTLSPSEVTLSPTEPVLCDGATPFAENLNVLCIHSEPAGAWDVEGPHPGTQGISLILERRSWTSAEDGQAARDGLITQVGMGAGGEQGAFSWCHLQLTWDAEGVWMLSRPCAVSHHVRWSTALHGLLVEHGTPSLGAVGARGSSGGWAKLIDAQGSPLTLSASQSARSFVRVTAVEDWDVLNLRARRPQPGWDLPPKVGALAPDAQCVPLRVHPRGSEWRYVEAPDGTLGWAHSKYLKAQPTSECLR